MDKYMKNVKKWLKYHFCSLGHKVAGEAFCVSNAQQQAKD